MTATHPWAGARNPAAFGHTVGLGPGRRAILRLAKLLEALEAAPGCPRGTLGRSRVLFPGEEAVSTIWTAGTGAQGRCRPRLSRRRRAAFGFLEQPCVIYELS